MKVFNLYLVNNKIEEYYQQLINDEYRSNI